MVDTTFSRVDMARYAIEVIGKHLPRARIIRYTVPGIKDVPAAARKLMEESDIVMTFGWIGGKPADKYSYLAASIGLITLQVLTGKHIIDVTVHEDESEDPDELHRIALDRATKHALNLVALLTRGGEGLARYAGMGLRQGTPDVGPLRG